MANMWRGRGRAMMTGLSQLIQATAEARGAGIASTSYHEIMSANTSSLISLRALSSLIQQPLSRGFAAAVADGAPPASGPPDGHYIALNNISDNPGATKTVRFFFLFFFTQFILFFTAPAAVVIVNSFQFIEILLYRVVVSVVVSGLAKGKQQEEATKVKKHAQVVALK